MSQSYKFTPMKTRGLSKSSKPNSYTFDDSTKQTSPNSTSFLAAVENALTNIETVSRLAELVAVRVAESVNKQITDTLKGVLKDVEDLRQNFDTLKENMNIMEDKHDQRLDELEQYQRRNNLRVFGIDEKDNEDTDNMLIDLFRTKLGVEITSRDIDRSHRVGTNRKTEPVRNVKPRPIIIKFISYRTRREVFMNKKKLKGSGVTLKEDLTSHRVDLLRRAVELHGPGNVWTLDGRVKWITADKKRGQATWKL